MKRITNIELENFRAFYGLYDIHLSTGENLLIYGENGSGKSSLFKALKDFLSSSRDASILFQKNNYLNAGEEGNIKISFTDFSPSPFVAIPGTEQHIDFGSAGSSNNIPFVQNADLIKGFFDYRNLLAVYLREDSNPNLFELIVINILSNHIPSGGTYRLGPKWLQLQEDLITNSRTRTNRIHKRALGELVNYENSLITTLTNVFRELNRLLSTYFPELRIQLGYSLQHLNFNYGYKWEWHTTADLRLQLQLDGVLITGDYSDILNEARLSAFALCMYLASIKCNPENFDLKLIFLDDVFVGLDTGNRIPILHILLNEFEDWQIFISTYDRLFYELAQRFFISHSPDKWKSIELYISTITVGANTFSTPILLPYEENYDKGVYYLHHKSKPDYPAAANFFRKSAEEILKNNVPICEIRDDNYTLIETYRLGALINSALHFFDKIGADKSSLLQLKTSLPTLLHPLSHYDLTSQVYKGELEQIQKLLITLENQLILLKSTYRKFIPPGRMFKLNFVISATDTGHYEIYTKEMIYALRDVGGAVSISLGNCHCKTCYIINGAIQGPPHNFANNNPIAQYTSVQNSYDTIYNHIHGNPAYAHIAQVGNCLTEFSYQNENGNHNLEDHKALIVW